MLFRSDRPGRLLTLPGSAVGIVFAGAGYPAERSAGVAISGVEEARRRGSLVFHAGMNRGADGWVTDGGRILTVVGRGPDLSAARAIAETGAQAISFEGSQRRHDIGLTHAVAHHPTAALAR